MAEIMADAVSLGSYTDTVNALPRDTSFGETNNGILSVDVDQQKAQLKQDLLHSAKELLPEESRLQACMSLRIRSDAVVTVEYAANADRSRLLNVCRCDNPHYCPNCGPIIAEKKRRLLQEDIRVWELAAHSCAFVVLTVQHKMGERLSEVDCRIDDAFKKMMNSRAGKRFKAKWSIIHRQRNPDVTYGENGWHSHRNFIFYFERRLFSDGEITAFRADLSRLWASACKSVGAYASLKHGAVVKFENVFDAADYIASKATGAIIVNDEASKWGVAEEVTKHQYKDNGGKSPTDLLLDYSFGDAAAGRLWQEYAHHFKGKKFVDSTPGLRILLDELKEQYAEQLAALFEDEVIPEYNPVLYLSPVAFDQLGKLQILYWFLLEVRRSEGDAAHLREWLKDWDITETFSPELDKQLPDWWIMPDEDVPKEDIEAIRELNQFIKDWNSGVYGQEVGKS